MSSRVRNLPTISRPTRLGATTRPIIALQTS